MKLTRAELARLIEAPLTRPDATRADVEQFCARARGHGLYGVAVNGARVELARTLLEETDVKVVALVGFPLGAADSDVKRYEAEVAVDQGAQEIELVVNMGRLKEGDHAFALRELRDVVEAAEERPVKAVFEFRFLDADQKRAACEIVADSGARYISVATGLIAPASSEDVKLVRGLLTERIKVKAAGVLDWETGKGLLAAGASRLGVLDVDGLLAALDRCVS